MANFFQNKLHHSIKIRHLFSEKEGKISSKVNSENINICHTPKPIKELEYNCSDTNFSFNDKNTIKKKFPFDLFHTKNNKGKRFSQIVHCNINQGKKENVYINPNLQNKPSTLIPLGNPCIPIFEYILSIKKRCIDLFQNRNNLQKFNVPPKDSSLPPLKHSPEHNLMNYFQIRNSAFSRLSTNYANENEIQETILENNRKQLFSTKEDRKFFSKNSIKIFNKRKTNIISDNFNLLGTEENMIRNFLIQKNYLLPTKLDMNTNFKKLINSETKIKVQNTKKLMK